MQELRRSVCPPISNIWQRELFGDYLLGKQTLRQLAKECGKTRETIRRHLDCYVLKTNGGTDRPMVLGIDCSSLGRGYGTILARWPSLKKNLYWKEISTESEAVYQEASDIWIVSASEFKRLWGMQDGQQGGLLRSNRPDLPLASAADHPEIPDPKAQDRSRP